MKKALSSMLVAALVASGTLVAAGLARADVSNASADNVQQGQNRTTGSQSGTSKSGSAVGGQVTGVVSGGKTSVDAKNTSKDSDVSSGNAIGTNSASAFTGLNSSSGGPTVTSDITKSCNGSGCGNLQEGDNRVNFSQTANTATGDGVGGEVIGVITTGGSASIVAANNSDGVDVSTGDAHGTNDAAAFAGLNTSGQGPLITSDLTNVCNDDGCANLQQGDNRITSSQTTRDGSGDGVAGQVIGAVSGGNLSIDAKNTTTDSTVETGDASGKNSGSYYAGLNTSVFGPTVTASEISGSCNDDGCANVQDGDNTVRANQSTSATSGDGVAGQVIGAVTLPEPRASIVAANTTKDSDVDTGNATATNDLAAFVGLNTSGRPVVTSDLTNVCNTKGEGCDNLQQGDNRLSGNQTAHATTGDGVAGEVMGVLAAGNTSLDATNHSEGDTVDTGNAKAANDASTFVGLNSSDSGPTITGAEISNATATNLQEGDNRKTIGQTADATSGDAVAGQVTGVVTSAGGSASVVLANTSTDIDSSSGHSDFSNTDSQFVGLNVSNKGPLVG
jgi:hypothetical protein